MLGEPIGGVYQYYHAGGHECETIVFVTTHDRVGCRVVIADLGLAVVRNLVFTWVGGLDDNMGQITIRKNCNRRSAGIVSESKSESSSEDHYAR